jgi:hypothetical protein
MAQPPPNAIISAQQEIRRNNWCRSRKINALDTRVELLAVPTTSPDDAQAQPAHAISSGLYMILLSSHPTVRRDRTTAYPGGCAAETGTRFV